MTQRVTRGDRVELDGEEVAVYDFSEKVVAATPDGLEKEPYVKVDIDPDGPFTTDLSMRELKLDEFWELVDQS